MGFGVAHNVAIKQEGVVCMMSQQRRLATLSFVTHVKTIWFVSFEVLLKESSHVRFTSHKRSPFSSSLVKRLQKRIPESGRQSELSAADPGATDGDNFDRHIGSWTYRDVDGSEECFGRKISMAMMNQMGRMREGEVSEMAPRGSVSEIEQTREAGPERERSVCLGKE